MDKKIGDDEDFEIDLSELEKIKEEKTQQMFLPDVLSNSNGENFDDIDFNEDPNFDITILNSIESFKKDISLFKRILKRPITKEISKSGSGYKLDTIFEKHIQEDIEKHKSFINKLIEEDKKAYARFIKKSSEQKLVPRTKSTVTNNELQAFSPAVLQAFKESNIFELLETKRKIIWTEHGKARRSERYDGIEDPEDIIEIEKFLQESTNKHSIGIETEEHFRTRKVHTFRIVYTVMQLSIFVKTLYRVDKESKEEYLLSKKK